MEKMQKLIEPRELGSTPESSQDALMEYAQNGHDPNWLRQAYLTPLEQRMGKGRGREEFIQHIKRMEKRLRPQNGGY